MTRECRLSSLWLLLLLVQDVVSSPLMRGAPSLSSTVESLSVLTVSSSSVLGSYAVARRTDLQQERGLSLETSTLAFRLEL